MELEEIRDWGLRGFCYLYSEYIKFTDELVKVLIEQFPWFGDVLN